MDKEELVSYLANANNAAFTCLMECLLTNGALKPGQLVAAIKGTFNYPAADWERMDYVFLRLLTVALENAETKRAQRTDG